MKHAQPCLGQVLLWKGQGSAKEALCPSQPGRRDRSSRSLGREKPHFVVTTSCCRGCLPCSHGGAVAAASLGSALCCRGGAQLPVKSVTGAAPALCPNIFNLHSPDSPEDRKGHGDHPREGGCSPWQHRWAAGLCQRPVLQETRLHLRPGRHGHEIRRDARAGRLCEVKAFYFHLRGMQ